MYAVPKNYNRQHDWLSRLYFFYFMDSFSLHHKTIFWPTFITTNYYRRLTLPILMFLESQLGSNCWPCRFAWAFILASFLIDRGTKSTTKFLAGILAVSIYAAPFILGIVPEYSAKISSLTQGIVLEEQFFGPKVGKSLDNSNELIRDGQFVIWTNCQVCNYQKRLEDVTTRKLVNPNVMILSLSKDKYDHDLPKGAYIVPEFVFDDLEVSIQNPPVYIETKSSRVEKVEKL